MADILIKGMKIPSCCDRCFYTCFCSAHARQVQKIMESDAVQVFDVFSEMRLKDCPIVEVKEGKWAEIEEDVYECSVCGEAYILDDTPMAHKYHFCPNCGAMMEVEHGLAD